MSSSNPDTASSRLAPRFNILGFFPATDATLGPPTLRSAATGVGGLLGDGGGGDGSRTSAVFARVLLDLLVREEREAGSMTFVLSGGFPAVVRTGRALVVEAGAARLSSSGAPLDMAA